MGTAVYARVSTDQQDPSIQLAELREYCSRRADLELVDEFVCSGARDSRPKLNELLTAARQRKIDCVLVWKIDRLGRSLRHLVNTISDLEAVGVAFISYKDALDFSTPGGRLMFNVIEFERDLIPERTRAGLQKLKLAGVKLGRPMAKVNVSAIQELRASGASWSEIARQTGLGRGTYAQRRLLHPPIRRRGRI